MSLNIKNERTHALVRELATATGMSQTEAVEDAVRRRLDQLAGDVKQDREAEVDQLMELAAQIAEQMPPGALDDVDAWLYDESGLPA